MSTEEHSKNHLWEVCLVFLKLGITAFGGPAAHIAMMEQEIVEKRKWITPEHFLDLIGATNLIPGPNSTELTMHCGYERAGWKGLIVGGASFIFPATLITGLLAWFYEKYSTLPEISPFIEGIKPAVIAIIIMAGYKLGKKALKSVELGIIGGITLIACLLGVNEIIALFSAGILGIIISLFKKNRSLNTLVLPMSFLLTQTFKLNENHLKIFLTFLKVGAILYGSGYVLFAFLETELVQTGWLTKQQLLDAVAMGQFTPGPVLSTSTFIGWQLGGFWGAILATIGMFLPSFFFVLVLNKLIPKMKKSKILNAFLQSVNVAAVALIFAVCYEMTKSSIQDWRSITVMVISLVIVFLFKKLNSAYIVLGGALLGYLLHFV